MSEREEAGADHAGAAAGAPAEAQPPGRLDGIVESLLFAAGTPVSLRALIEVLKGPPAREVKAALERLMQFHAGRERGIRLVMVAGGYQFRTAPENADWVRALLRERPPRLGRAALETLAIVAYKQPVTRADIEAIRGVDVESALASLLAKRLIRIAGRKESVGRPLVYATTPEFLEVFSLRDLGELPALKEIGPAPETEDDGVSEDASGGPPAEAAQPRGDQLASRRGELDPGGAGAGERPGGAGAGDAGGPGAGPDHG